MSDGGILFSVHCFLESKFGGHAHIYEGNDKANKLAGLLTKTDPTIHPFPTSAKNFFVGNHRLSGHQTPITNVGHTIKKAQHKQWRAKATKKTMYTEEDPSITHEANKISLSTNTDRKSVV